MTVQTPEAIQPIPAEIPEWSILRLIKWSTDYFAEKQIDSPRLTAELLLSHVLHCSRIDLYAQHDKPLTKDELARFKSVLRRRLLHEPVQYIVGETEFMGIPFAVDRRALIPRPETEILVEQVLKLSVKCANPPLHILDIGTGCGNIAISLAKKIGTSIVDAIDSDSSCLTLARENVRRHGLIDRVRLFHADILHTPYIPDAPPYDVIVSNPPYISREEFELLQPEVKNFEPANALTDGGDGLSFYRAICAAGKLLLRPGGCVAVEVAYNQGDRVRSIFVEGKFRDVAVERDYDGNERVVHATWN
jgi:release factor glutamine methyltransferase